jgi:NAD(P)-dependent dehydrogenase (short-subunit alcohol dehydrogenase family)|tara:strand:- start:57 stop:869 length:813 start_codon:yes stop_codon:yes gene_type:complete
MTYNKIATWYDLSEEIIVLTGAAGKLGRHYANAFLKADAKVVLLDSSQEALDSYLNELDESYHPNALPLACDITDKKEVEEAFGKIKNTFGNCSILVNNAAAVQVTFLEGSLVDFEEFPIEVWKSNLDVNLTGAFLCCQEAGKHMLDRKKGVILNISSIYGVVGCDQRIYGDSGLNSNVAYAATKSGLINFTRYLASYWQGKNIRVNCLSPGGVYNNQPDEFYENYTSKTMLKKMSQPEDLVSAIFYLVSDASGMVTGINHLVDGGYTAW